MSKFFAAADLLSVSDFSGAFAVLDLAFRRTGQLLKLDVPKLLPVLLLVYARLDLRGAARHVAISLGSTCKDRLPPSSTPARSSVPYSENVSALDVDRYDDVFPRLF